MHVIVMHNNKWCPAILPDHRRVLEQTTCQLYQKSDRATRRKITIIGAKTVFHAKKFIYKREGPPNIWAKAYPGEILVLSREYREQLVQLRKDRLENFGGQYL